MEDSRRDPHRCQERHEQCALNRQRARGLWRTPRATTPMSNRNMPDPLRNAHWILWKLACHLTTNSLRTSRRQFRFECSQSWLVDLGQRKRSSSRPRCFIHQCGNHLVPCKSFNLSLLIHLGKVCVFVTVLSIWILRVGAVVMTSVPSREMFGVPLANQGEAGKAGPRRRRFCGFHQRTLRLQICRPAGACQRRVLLDDVGVCHGTAVQNWSRYSPRPFMMAWPVQDRQTHVTSASFKCASCPSSCWWSAPVRSTRSGQLDSWKWPGTHVGQTAMLRRPVPVRPSRVFQYSFLAKEFANGSWRLALCFAQEGSVSGDHWSSQDPGSCSVEECSSRGLPGLFVRPALQPLTLVSDGCPPLSFGSLVAWRSGSVRYPAAARSTWRTPRRVAHSTSCPSLGASLPFFTCKGCSLNGRSRDSVSQWTLLCRPCCHRSILGSDHCCISSGSRIPICL